MRSTARRTPLVLAAGLMAIAVAACGGPAPSAASSAASSAGTAGAGATPVPSTPASPPPTPTEVPGGESTPPGTLPSRFPTTRTDWGEILDGVPGGFPVYPGARVAEPPAGPVSAAYIAQAGVTDVATWYRTSLEALGFATTNLSEPLEDGSRVLDSQGDLPECRLQTTFTPEDGSTMITVLYGSGCAGGGG